ncbi:MAG: UDP-3-O-(3-hydroxymyristoyl)glucosamine N-acyltransferase [Deltaproteobacteria bacterium]|nr:UDP-3-O-(3-hydroxymyristoyl)glucosamine N-acyltransferase [Deltaproteobacteria bacterium]
MSQTVSQLAERVGGEVRGDGSVEIHGAASAESGKPGEISFVENEKFLETALAAQASCLIVPPSLDTGNVPAIVVDHPKLAFARILRALNPRPSPATGVHPSAVVEESAKLGRDVHVGAHVYIGEDAHCEDGVVIGAGSVVERGVRIGRDCYLHARVVVAVGCVLGERVELHSGVVIGADGFGYVSHAGGHEKFPQLGTVVIGDDVEVGANTTIDRGALDPTRIGNGTKIDNLVQIAHNVQIGEHCMICAQTGIAGSAVIGNYVMMLGQTAAGDHAVLEDGVVLTARTATLPGKTYAGGAYLGAPAVPAREAMRQIAATARLPDALRRLARLERELRELKDAD